MSLSSSFFAEKSFREDERHAIELEDALDIVPVGVVPLVADCRIPDPDHPSALQLFQNLFEERGIMGRSGMQEETDRPKRGVVDCSGELVPDEVTVAGGIAPPEFSLFQLLLGEGFPEPVEIQGDCGTIDENRRLSPPSSRSATGVQESVDQGDEGILSEPVQEPVEGIHTRDFGDREERAEFLPGLEFSHRIGDFHG